MNLALYDHLKQEDRWRFQNLDFTSNQAVNWQKFGQLRFADPSTSSGNSYNFEIKGDRIGWARMFNHEQNPNHQFILLHFFDGNYAEVSSRLGRTKSGKMRYYCKLNWMGELIGYIDDRQSALRFQQCPGFPVRIYDSADRHSASIVTQTKFASGRDTFSWKQNGIEGGLDFNVDSCRTRRVFPDRGSELYDMRVFLMINCLFRMALQCSHDFAA